MISKHASMMMLVTASLMIAPTVAWAQAQPTQMSASEAASDSTGVVEGIYAAFATGDGAALAAAFAPDLVWVEAENGPYADRNPYVGPGAVFEGVFGRIGQEWTNFAATPQTLLPSGSRVVALGRYTGVNKATGEALDAQFVHVWTVADGKVVAFQQYTDTAQWNDTVAPD